METTETCCARAFVLAVGLSAVLVLFACGHARADETEIRAGPPAERRISDEERLRLEKHRPIYAAYSSKVSKLQFSFKAMLLDHMPLYFGYSQVIFWRLSEDSRPINDVTFNPEFFYRLRPFAADSFLESVDLGFLEHQSNGKGGGDSRSLNSSYVGLNFHWSGRRWLTKLATKFSFCYDFDDTNADILDYWGPTQFELSFIQLFDAWVDKTEFKLTAHPGGKFSQGWNRGGYMAEVSFRLGGIAVVPAFYVQYYRGYAESLLNFRDNVSELRGGVIF